MLSLRIENLRSLKDTGEIKLKPITVLVGQNSSGKSTFLRSFPLLKQSVESRITGPLLWYGQYVDMGDFKTALSNDSTDREIRFHFQFQHKPRLARAVPQRLRIPAKHDSTLDIRLMMGVAELSTKGEALISRYKIDICKHTIELSFKEDGKITGLIINSQEYIAESKHFVGVQRKSLLCLHADRVVSPDDEIANGKRLIPFYDRLHKIMDKYLHRSTSNATRAKLIDRFVLGTSEEMLDGVKSLPGSSSFWRTRVSHWNIDTPEFIGLQNAILGLNLSRIILACDDELSNFSRNVKYIAPVRATAERYYRTQNLSVDELDHTGQNLPTLLSRLSDSETKDFYQWVNEHFGFSVKVHSSEGHISLRLMGDGAISDYNLADMGFGYSQILPIILQVWSFTNGRFYRNKIRNIFTRSNVHTITMEQPELHLHPTLQAYLIDALISVLDKARDQGIDVKLVIETHSETIVNRLGENIAEGNLDEQDVNVVIFDKTSTDAGSAIEIGEYDEEGYLKNWPYGFFEPNPVKPRKS